MGSGDRRMGRGLEWGWLKRWVVGVVGVDGWEVC